MMMINFYSPAFFVLLLTFLLLAITQISAALDEVNVERFYIWTSIAFIIAGLPMILR